MTTHDAWMRQLMACATAGTLLIAPAARADEASDLRKEVLALQDQLRRVMQRLDAVESQAAKAQAVAPAVTAPTAAATAANTAAAAKPQPRIAQSAANKFAFESADGKYSIGPTGIVQIDSGGYLGFTPQSSVVGAQKLTSGVNARRARIGVSGKLFGDWTYKFLYDGGNSQDTTASGIEAAQVSYTGYKGVIIDLPGYSATPFTLDQATSSTDLLFLERSTPTNIAIGFNAGDSRINAGVRFFSDRYWVGSYFTGPASGDSHTNVSERFGAFQRATYQVVSTPEATVHLGVAMDELIQAPDTGPGTAKQITLSDRPELRIDPTTLVSTGALGTVASPVTSGRVYNLEAAATYQSFMVQGEYFHYQVERRNLPTNNFDGAYLQASWVLTGERHPYERTTGSYTSVVPTSPFSLDGGSGAWEIAARISYVNLTDSFSPNASLGSQPFAVNGGRQTSYTFGTNWYVNTILRFTLNYIHTDVRKANSTAVAGALLGTPVGVKADAVAARAQFAF